MFPITMMYCPTETDTNVKVDVYSIQATCDAEGVPYETVVCAWDSKVKSWIVAPLWCFKPIESKLLTE